MVTLKRKYVLEWRFTLRLLFEVIMNFYQRENLKMSYKIK